MALPPRIAAEGAAPEPPLLQEPGIEAEAGVMELRDEILPDNALVGEAIGVTYRGLVP